MFCASGQEGQLNIPRVQQMPNLPSPYIMRDWRQVSMQYDQFIFSSASGLHLPLLSTKPMGINFPNISPILLDTYVGTNSSSQAEAINIIPAVVSASLVGIDKSNQAGMNWVAKVREFYNKANGQNVFLNGYSTQSGGDWWYDVMPNVFFYQLYSLYPQQQDFSTLAKSSADRWLEAVHAMGGNTRPWTVPQMNYRAWNLMTMTGKTEGVKEPEAAGAIGWILYNAYLNTGEEKYLDGAQQCLEFLSALTSNPSYELQLPYGVLTAAKMNAQLRTSYDVSKMINWTFDKNPLRGWGAIVGTWNGSDVHGLLGEASGTNDYAFVMNGFQHAAALVPLVKYDKRYTRAIAKWVLNLANASRLFYPKYLPQSSQDDYLWSSTYDSESTIAYEGLKQKHDSGVALYGTGDAKRNNWAETNLSLYSSSSVGYLGAIVNMSDVEGILILDLNRTDFFESDTSPRYAMYNPHATDKQITLPLPGGPFDIYDALSETVIASNVSTNTSVTVKADEAVLLVLIPAGTSASNVNGKLYAGNEVIDYHYGYDFNPPARIKSLAVLDTLVEYNQEVPIYLATENVPAGTMYNWYNDAVLISSSTKTTFTWTVPMTSGAHVLRLTFQPTGGPLLEDSIVFNIVDRIPLPPTINSISAGSAWVAKGATATLTCAAADDTNTKDELTYVWSVSAGTLTTANSATATWQVPSTEGIVKVTCVVTDTDGMTTTQSISVLVKSISTGTTQAFAYYPLNGDVKDYSGNHHDAQMTGVEPAIDANGDAGNAYQFNSGTDIIFLPNTDALNFQDKITLSFWLRLESLAEESFVLSHGSWEERWKVSVNPDKHLRWTVKTNSGTKDLDSSFPLEFNHFYHFTVVYSGYSMELYVDGEPDNFITHSGLMNTTNKSLTFGRKDASVTRYSLFGVLDEVRIYNATLMPDEIHTLPSVWNDVITGLGPEEISLDVFPNPARGHFFIRHSNTTLIKSVKVYDLHGREVKSSMTRTQEQTQVIIGERSGGMLLVEIQTPGGVLHRKITINE